jgi:hypothetical protein
LGMLLDVFCVVVDDWKAVVRFVGSVELAAVGRSFAAAAGLGTVGLETS